MIGAEARINYNGRMTRIGIPVEKPQKREVPFAPPLPTREPATPVVTPSPATPVRTPIAIPATR